MSPPLGESHTAGIAAKQMLAIVGSNQLEDTALEVRRRLSTVIDGVAHIASWRVHRPADNTAKHPIVASKARAAKVE